MSRLLLLVTISGVFACGTTPTRPCSAASCPLGCCSAGRCEPGTLPSACGTNGAACVTCRTGDQCTLNRCTSAGGGSSGGSSAGGSAAGGSSAGGSSAGGSTAGGSAAGGSAAGGSTAGGSAAGGSAGGGSAGGMAGGGAARRWANLQWPPWATLDAGASLTMYGQVWVEGRTGSVGATPGLSGEVGFGPHGTRPDDPDAGWSWQSTTFNVDVGNNDEVQGPVTPLTPGVWDVAFRMRLPAAFAGAVFGDRSDRGRVGSDDGYQTENAGRLVVPGPGARLEVASLNLQCLTGDVAARLDAAAQRFAQLGTDVIALQEVCVPAQDAGVTDTAEMLAGLLSTRTGRRWTSRFAFTHLANNVTPEGLGLVTALPLSELQVIDLPVGDFQRRALIGVVASSVGMVAVAATHFSFRTQDAQVRVAQANAIVTALGQLMPATPRQLVLGDLNAIPTEACHDVFRMAGFVDAWNAVHPSLPGFTHTSTSPTRRIDYVWARGPLDAVAAETQFGAPFRGTEYVSDHLGLTVEFSTR
ncbi:MAG: endonuclease/exonuclease/phosphatase family protein [Myxococcaceae bacterium]|nr:endonuclease/exonuclease/phosphatase family protein [Myxococcaceae bacterium]